MREPFLKGLFLDILNTAEVLSRDVIFKDYFTSYRNLRQFIAYGIPERRVESKAKESFYNMLSRLKREGLIEPSREQSGTWRITQKGKEWLAKYKLLKKQVSEPTNEKDYLKIIAFDIPENQKAKRQWLRNTIAELGFSMLQKSLWIGENKLPSDFMKNLQILGIDKYVHVFAISKQGTINHKNKPKS
jgi:DNA-binding transcriptional regulator PaaX